jgi:uncharacterized protein YbjT (DUF2867 family)
MNDNKTALVVGSTGLIGSVLLKELLTDDYYQKIAAWVRKPAGLVHPKLIEKVTDFNGIDDFVPQPVTHVYCCLGTTIKKVKTKEAFRKVDFGYVIDTAKYALRCGAEKFVVVSSIGAGKNSSVFYLQTKGEMEEALMKLPIPCIIIFRPSLLLGKRNEFRLGELFSKMFMSFAGIFLLGKLKKYCAIKASHVALAMKNISREDKKGIFIIESDQIEKYSS